MTGERGGRSPLEPAELATELDRRRAEGATVAFTCGDFELFHPGHLRLLRRARALADHLVVAISDDACIATREGPGRPVVPLDERLDLIAAVRWVDFTVVFSGDVPTDLISSLRPEFVVEPTDRPGARRVDPQQLKSWGGRVVSVDLAAAYSTEALVSTVQQSLLE